MDFVSGYCLSEADRVTFLGQPLSDYFNNLTCPNGGSTTILGADSHVCICTS